MTRKEYEEKLSELDAKFHDDDTSYEECEEIARRVEELHERYSHYDEEILKETLAAVQDPNYGKQFKRIKTKE